MKQTPEPALIDLKTATLRSEWTESDLRHVLANERLLASFDAILRNPSLEEASWVQRLSLIFQRQFTLEEDYHQGVPHPRDLDLTAHAYANLTGRVLTMMMRGEIERDPAWQTRFPDLYNYDPAALPVPR